MSPLSKIPKGRRVVTWKFHTKCIKTTSYKYMELGSIVIEVATNNYYVDSHVLVTASEMICKYGLVI